jgi:restriction system protein
MKGLKNVRNRRTDALTHVRWDQLESLLVAYYRGQGYQVEHCGTGATGACFDGGIDLKLRKDDAYILVQCKHWNAKQVPHNDVHQLLGLMVNEGATGAILVTSGEFTRAAVEAALKQGHVQLVDGDDLRAMLGPLPEMAPVVAPPSEPRAWMMGAAGTVGERLLSAAEHRIRYGGARPEGRRRATVAQALGTGLWIVVLKLLLGLVVFVLLMGGIKSALAPLLAPTQTSAVQPQAANDLPVPQDVAPDGALPSVGTEPAQQWQLTEHGGRAQTGALLHGSPDYRRPTAEEIRESQRRADEAARIIEANTPEM